MKKPKITSAKPVSKVKPEPKTKQPAAAAASKTRAKTPSPEPTASKKAPAQAAKTVETTPEISMHARVGLTAGNIWQFLSENGAVSVAKLIQELPEEEKIIQRSIGWLAQEGKITLDTATRIETIGLK